jgi:hypothetical protein
MVVFIVVSFALVLFACRMFMDTLGQEPSKLPRQLPLKYTDYCMSHALKRCGLMAISADSAKIVAPVGVAIFAVADRVNEMILYDTF